MNAFEEAKVEVAQEAMEYVYKKLADKDSGLITKEALRYALYSYDMPKPSDEQVLDEMMQFLEKPQKTSRVVESVKNAEDSDEGEAESEEDDEGVDYDHFQRIFKNFKFKVTPDGNIL